MSSETAVGLTAAFRRATAALRYRFFVVAGAFPYMLGAAAAYRESGSMAWRLLAEGLAGIILVGAGIEGLNEHFDARLGGDRVFAFEKPSPGRWCLPVGIGGFALAFLIALHLAFLRGSAIWGFALFGAASAFSYLYPRIRLSHRGMGEAVIAVAYGPGLTLGSYWLQTWRWSWTCLGVSFLPALLILSVAIVNEVPDFYGDRLVGKRNIVVRAGRIGAVRLYGIVTMGYFAVLCVGLIGGIYPAALWTSLLMLPVALANWKMALNEYDDPCSFCTVIRRAILLYVLLCSLATIGYIVAAARPGFGFSMLDPTL